MNRKRTRWIIFIVLAALVIASVAFLITPDSKQGFQFLSHASLVSDFETVVPGVGGGLFYSAVATYRSELSVDSLGEMAEKELVVRYWKKASISNKEGSRSFTLMPKTILITTVSGETNVYIFESRPANMIDRARVWMKGLWKVGKK